MREISVGGQRLFGALFELGTQGIQLLIASQRDAESFHCQRVERMRQSCSRSCHLPDFLELGALADLAADYAPSGVDELIARQCPHMRRCRKLQQEADK